MTTRVLFQNMPPLSPEEYQALEASILEHGIQSPVIVDEDGVVIDGHHRSKIASEHGLTMPKQIVYGKSMTEKRTLALSLNLDRRHLDREQRRELIAESVKADPQIPDYQHAQRTGTSDKTVTSVRRELEAHSEIPNDVPRINSRGQERPAQYQVRPAPEPTVPTFDPTPDWDSVNHETGEIRAEAENTTAPHPEPKETPEPTKPRRRPITDQFFDAAYDLRKNIERIDRLTGDDRFPKNKEQIALSHKNDLLQLAETLQHVLRELD